jgi:predicted RNase H-like HicB family nuclease
MRNEFMAIIEPAEEGGFWATCPEVPGANGQGETVEEVMEDLAAAIELMLEVRREDALRKASPNARREAIVLA